MGLSRREFLAAGAAGAVAASAAALEASAIAVPAFGPAASLRDDPRYLVGDPYRRAVEEPGLGGASFEAARRRATVWRVPPAERDRILLGLDPGLA